MEWRGVTVDSEAAPLFPPLPEKGCGSSVRLEEVQITSQNMAESLTGKPEEVKAVTRSKSKVDLFLASLAKPWTWTSKKSGLTYL